MLIYAGIGSRETPKDITDKMKSIATQLAPVWKLRSGHADGADAAFENGAIIGNGPMEIFLPWNNFNSAPRNNPSYIVPKITKELEEFSASFHPAWNSCSDAAKCLHTRNSCQIMGLYGDEPVDMVICWTKNGKRGGGTGQALRIAEFMQIPIFDLALADTAIRLCAFVNSKVKMQSAA